MAEIRPRNSLPPGTEIDCYQIEKLIGSGGFSLIYLARDMDSGEKVVIKEFLPKKLARREQDSRSICLLSDTKVDSFHQGRKLFYQEARVLATLKHTNIVRVRNFFLSNDTAYLIMDYEGGRNLGRYIKARKGGLSTTFLMTVFPPLLDALDLIHDHSLLHLDIKPSNIHLRPGGDPLILDFGAAHHVRRKGQSKTGRVITPGFSPLEQYYSAGNIGPWSDVYAVGATMRACIEGKPPPTSIERHAKDKMKPAVQAFKRRYSKRLLELVDWAMEISEGNRPQTAAELRHAMLEHAGRPSADNATASGVG
ncbi:MAG: serine/threonine protein kinase [gamma proteobacterium symbiont of Bathyaustriella thionipta]|nr:serine/threonine protein kinase [gamma proteobacterium symbiont of Bathyaustriella thionipta]